MEKVTKMAVAKKGIIFSHKKNEILSFVATQINLEDMMLSEISQANTKINTTCGHSSVEAKTVIS
jgi:hypothetical protein